MAKITFPIGPQHPALKEPESFKITAEGECVVDVDIRLGYVHRSIEAACLARNYVQGQYVCERICGICSHIHSNTFARAVEDLLQLEVPMRAKYLRVLVAELERIHSHLLWLGVAAHEVGFDTLFMYVWRDREVIQDILEMVSGNRGHYAMTMLGGVRYDITPEMVTKIREGLAFLRQRAEYYADIATSEQTFLDRASGVGVVSGETCVQLGAVGPVLRASGVAFDVRRTFPYLQYDKVEFPVRTSELCDVLGRTLVRVQEVIDYSGLEADGLFLEGTGAMILDHADRVAYVGASTRADPIILERFCTHFGFEPMVFENRDPAGHPIYHTNVILSIGTEFALLCSEVMTDAKRRDEIVARLRDSGRDVIDISWQQVTEFAGNGMELTGSAGRFYACSARAAASYTPEQRERIEASAPIVAIDVPTIELAGGSVRCMLAGIHLSRR